MRVDYLKEKDCSWKKNDVFVRLHGILLRFSRKEIDETSSRHFYSSLSFLFH